MASYHHLSQHTKPRFESPAKVFAKLKSRVQREGMCAGKDPLSNVKEKHGAEFKSPRKRSEGTWMTDELKENQRFGSYRNEAQALTLSPISSPQKTFGCSYSNTISRLVEEMPPVTEIGRRKGAFLESTAVSHSPRKQIHTDPLQIRDLTSRTPVKIQPVESQCVRTAFEEQCAPLMSPVTRMGLRKRKWEPWGFNNGEVISQPQDRKGSSVFSEDDNTCMEDVDHVTGFSADRPEMNQLTHEPIFLTPRSTAKKRCHLVMDKAPPMSPAKMFAYMKERENKAEQQEVHNMGRSSRQLFDRGNFHESRDAPPSTVRNVAEMEDVAFRGDPETGIAVNRSRVDPADSQSDTDHSQDAVIPAAPSQPVLLEDPLVLNTPKISIPKKTKAVFKPKKWPQGTNFHCDSVIYLKKWFLRRNHKGLFVDGINQEDNIPWNSNIIVDRVSNFVLKTISGRVYNLVGKMNLDVNSGFPNWLLKKFVNGFPSNWKALYEKFLSESRDRGTERNSEGRGIAVKTKSEASSISLPVKQRRQKPLRTPDSCPPASSSSAARVSRSGRVIKPPLEYWKGGRVLLDAHMNVTIHECYNTSICVPEVSTRVSTKASQKPAHVFLPCSKGRKQCDSSSDKEVSVPLRRVKPPLRKRNRDKVNPEEKPSYSPDSPVETLSSPGEWSGRTRRSSQRSPAAAPLFVDTLPTVRVSLSKWAVPAPAEPPAVNDKTSPHQSSEDEDFSSRRKTRGKGVHKKRGEKTQPKYSSPSSDSRESGEELGKRTRVKKSRDAAQKQTKHKQNKCTKASQPVKTLPRSTQSSKKHKAVKGTAQIPPEQDGDQWTEAELTRLQEAVSFYPKHVAGYWAKVARLVGTRSAEECHNQHTSQGPSQTPAKIPKKTKTKKAEAPKDPVADHPVISARVGTLKRKQQVRQFLENMPKEDVDDVFSSACMQKKRFEMPSLCPSDDQDSLSDLEPVTPRSTGFPEIKTPQCLHMTPGMMGSPNRSNDEKYVYQLQKRMKKSQYNVCKKAPSKSFTPTPSAKRTMRKCANSENDTFVVWEMFQGNDGALSESGEEEDFYFSDND